MIPSRLISPRRWFHCFVGILMLAIGFPSGCSQDIKPTDFSGKTPVLRVLLLQSQSTCKITAIESPSIRLAGFASSRRVDIPPGTPINISYTSAGWQMGSASLGAGEMTLIPSYEGSVSIAGHAYRGRFRFVPHGAGLFDVVNDVDVEGYLKGVLPGEMFANFADEAYKAQAVVARTYAIYEKQMHSPGSEFDLYDDERSMMYNGLGAETTKSVLAVDQTRGVVVAYGSPGSERIFKAYFSSCCGGAGQSANEAFGDPVTPPLSATAAGSLCSGSPRFLWPTVTVTKSDLTSRIKHYAQIHNMPEKDIAAITSINIMSVNAVGRPVLFTITDAKNRRYAIVGEELRRAVNTDSTPKTKLWSSYFQLDNQPNEIRFVNGHGFGHGVGMCQWCAEKRAELGTGFREIVLLSYPQSTLVTAY
jgi:stage II sporulation protein D